MIGKLLTARTDKVLNLSAKNASQ